jgi:hypothetical protein
VLQIEEASVAIHGYLSGATITLGDETGEMMTVLHSLGASFERRRAKQRTHDALRRRAEAGAATGGRVFGYRNQRNGDGYVHRVVDADEAAVVRRIFAMYDEGAGLVRIAKALDAVPSPRTGTGSWAPTAIREMLRRDLYRGVFVWNKTQKIHLRGTKAQRDRAANEWIERAAPDLALIDADLWRRVQERLAAANATFLRRMDGRLIGRPSAPTSSPRTCSRASPSARCAAARWWR